MMKHYEIAVVLVSLTKHKDDSRRVRKQIKMAYIRTNVTMIKVVILDLQWNAHICAIVIVFRNVANLFYF